MAYYVDGKAYTDHPLLDEICYNCKLILEGIVIKNDVLANNYETDNSIQNFEMYYIYRQNGYISFDLFPFNSKILYGYGYTYNEVQSFLRDKYEIPVEDRAGLTDYANQYFLDNYFTEDGVFIEENDYYRMLSGLPPFNTGEEYYIWLTDDDIPEYYEDPYDLTIPLHEQPKQLVEVLYAYGVIDKLKETYVGSKYSYMNYLGDKKINLTFARKAGKWDILYMPNVYYLIEDKFTEFYKANREDYLNKSYQDYFAESGEYYDQMMILIVLAQTFNDLVTDTPQWYIRRDVFDIRSCKYFLESSGVDFFKEIPLKYQIRIVKNLNTLIKYKSTNKNNQDIIDIFNIDGISIYKYWLHKGLNKAGEPELDFIASDYRESYDAYIKDAKYRTPYDDITYQDKYWDAELGHDYIKNNILKEDFTIRGTKYMSIEYNIDLAKYLYEMEYMMGLLLDTVPNFNDLLIGVPSINEFSQFKIADLFLFLICVTNIYNTTSSGTNDARFPREAEGDKPVIDEDHYDWKMKYMSNMYIRKDGRVNAFNPNLNKNELISTLEARHYHYRFGMADRENEKPLVGIAYKKRADEWIDELGVFDYIVPNITISTIDDLMTVYDINSDVYDRVHNAMVNAEEQNDRKTLEYIHQELFTRKFDKDLYAVPSNGGVYYDNLIEVLRSRNYVLYNEYTAIVNEKSLDSRQDMIRSVLNDVIETLSYYLGTDQGLDYLYAFTANESFSAIISYVYKMISFFKSYKVYFLDPYITYNAADKVENSVKPIERISEWKIKTIKWDRDFVVDCIGGINAEKFFEEITIRDKQHEQVDIYMHHEPDPGLDYDFDGTTPDDISEYTDLDGGTADDAECVPYFTVNGGVKSGKPSVNLSNIDGGEPDEKGRDYYELDGGRPYDSYDNKTDMYGSQQFNYIIDGGSPDGKRFITTTMDVYIVGTQLFMQAVTSDRNTLIEIREDGLYVDENRIASISQFNNLKDTVSVLVKWIKGQGESTEADLQLLTDYNKVIQRITRLVNNITYDIETVNDSMIYTDSYKEQLLAYIDFMCTNLRNTFKDRLNPYMWEEL